MQLLKALTSQILGLLAALLLLRLAPAEWQGMLPTVTLQAVCAAGLSRLLRQPRWWIPMHLLFAPAALGMLALQLPAWLYLLATLLMVLVFWGTVKGDVPLFLSSPAVAAAVARIARREDAKTFADLGAGLGSVVVPLARELPRLEIEAWERAPLPWAICSWRCRKLLNVRMYRMNFWECDFSHYDIVFAFLSPLPMPVLGDKVRREMRDGSLLVSSSFEVPGWTPEEIMQLPDARGTRLYCYRVQAP